MKFDTNQATIVENHSDVLPAPKNDTSVEQLREPFGDHPFLSIPTGFATSGRSNSRKRKKARCLHF